MAATDWGCGWGWGGDSILFCLLFVCFFSTKFRGEGSQIFRILYLYFGTVIKNLWNWFSQELSPLNLLSSIKTKQNKICLMGVEW